MHTISRFSSSSFNCFVRQSTTRRLLIRELLNGFQPRYFSHTTQPNFSLRQRNFYEIPPSRNIHKQVASQETEFYRQWSEQHFSIQQDVYSEPNGVVRSWVTRFLKPSRFLEIMTQPKKINSPSRSLLNFAPNIPFSVCQETLAQQGGKGLSNISPDGLKVVWEELKKYHAYNKMIELFHCCLPSSFTASLLILSDYSFAQLKSSYSQPPLVIEIATRMLEENPLPLTHYVRGLAHMVRAHVAQDLYNLKGEKDIALEDRYRECFKLAAYEDSLQHYQEALALAEVEFKQAFEMQPTGQHALAGILNLIEQRKLKETYTWSTSIWQDLQKQTDRSTQDVHALVIAGIITDQQKKELEHMVNMMLTKEPGLKTEYLENLQLLAPHFPVTQQMIETLSS